MSYELRPYQKDAVEEIEKTKVGERCLISIPTGGGKTVCMAQVANNVENRIVFVLPSKELREQTIDKLKQMNDKLDIGSVQSKLDEVGNKIVCCTRQSLTSGKSTRIERIMQNGDNIDYLFFDEVHNAPEQIKKIIAKFNGDKTRVIGVTATPFNPELAKIFPKINYNKSILELIDDGYLIEPRALQVFSKTDISSVKTVAGEFNQKQLEEVTNNDDRNELIVEAYKKYSSDRKATLVYASGIDHARSIAEEFKRNGIACESVDSTLDDTERERILNDFITGKLKVLVNVSILTTGIDIPKIDCIIIARPTKSKILYFQICGRGLRLSPETNKENCLFIDVVDVTNKHDLMGIEDVFEIPMINGESRKEAKERIDKEEQAEKDKQEQIKQERERQRQKELELIAKQIELFNRDMMKTFKENEYYDWYLVKSNIYAVSVNNDIHYAIEKENGEFNIYYIKTKKDEYETNLVDTSDNLVETIRRVEQELIDHPTSFTYKKASWKDEPATEKQRYYVPQANNKWQVHIAFTSRKVSGGIWHYKNDEMRD